MIKDDVNQKTKSSTFPSNNSWMQTRGFDSNVNNAPDLQEKSEASQEQSEEKSSRLDLSRISVFAPATPTPPPIQAMGINANQPFEMNESNPNSEFMFNPVNQTTPNIQTDLENTSENNNSTNIVQRSWDDVKATAKDYLVAKRRPAMYDESTDTNRQNMPTGKKIAQIAGRSAMYIPKRIPATIKTLGISALAYGANKIDAEAPTENSRERQVDQQKVKESENWLKENKERLLIEIKSMEAQLSQTTDNKKRESLKFKINKRKDEIAFRESNIATKSLTGMLKQGWDPRKYNFYG